MSGGSLDQASLANSFNTMTLNPPPSTSEWYAYSGAAAHMTSNVGILSTTCPPMHTPSSIVVGNGSLLPVTSIGSLSFPTSHRSLLNDVLVSPNTIKNLLSIRRFTTDNNC